MLTDARHMFAKDRLSISERFYCTTGDWCGDLSLRVNRVLSDQVALGPRIQYTTLPPHYQDGPGILTFCMHSSGIRVVIILHTTSRIVNGKNDELFQSMDTILPRV